MSVSHTFYRLLWKQPWIRQRYGRPLYKKICRQGEAPDVPFETDFFGLRYRGNLQNTIDFNVYYYGAFEKPLLFFLRDCFTALQNPAAVFCDIGANIGQHSLFVSRLAGQVHAFEPFDKVRERLADQIACNGIRNIQIHPVGLSDQNQSLPFYAPTGRNQGIGSFDASSTSKGNQPIGELKLVRGDDYFAEHSIHPVNLVKIDVEGFEKSVLCGLRQVLTAERPIVVCELTYGTALSIRSLTELSELFPPGYRFFTFDVRKPDGSKARRQEAKARSSGAYRLTDFSFAHPQGQDDIIACPEELLPRLPRQNHAN